MTRPTPADQSDPVRLCLLATTDLHMNLTGWDYAKDAPLPCGGLGRVAQEITDIRQAAQRQGTPVLLFDNGDGSQGTVLSERAMATPDSCHPLMQAFDVLGYDAAGLGNHDFDLGAAGLQRLLRDAPCPILCANLTPQPEGAQRSTILPVLTSAGPLRVGVLSVLPPQTAIWNAEKLSADWRFADMTDTARAQVAALRQAGCDLVVVLAHTGLGATDHQPGQENALHPLAALDVDAIFAGHTHKPWSGTLNAIPIALAGANGAQLARIDLQLQPQPQGWRVTGGQAALIDMPDNTEADALPADPALREAMTPWHHAARAHMNRQVGQTDQHLHSYFSLIQPDAHLHFLAETMHQATRGDLLPNGLPVLAAMAPAKCGGLGGPGHYTDVPPGPVLQRHIEDLVLFPNIARAAILTGAQLLDWMEMSVSVFHRLGEQPTGADAGVTELLNAQWPPHGFDTVFGLTYQIDLSQPARFGPDGTRLNAQARRISMAQYRGVPVRDSDRFTVLLTDYRANGGGYMPGLNRVQRIPLPDHALRQAVIERLVQPAPAAFDPQPWRFAPHPGQQVQLRTSPRALDLLDDIAAYDPRPGPVGTDGFLPIRLSL